jgi:hypothetical protein
MTTREQRHERRELKQKLFFIRRFIEGEPIKLSPELKQLKAEYEALPGFTNWSGFPDKWDIGDPNNVKSGAWGNEVDRRNFERAFGKGYRDIISKEYPDTPRPMPMAPMTDAPKPKAVRKLKDGA